MKRGPRPFRLFPVILITGSLLLLFLIFYLERASREYKRIPPVRFDPQHLIRVHEFSRIYKIARDDAFPGLLFFACEEGLLCLTEKDYRFKRYGLEHGLPSESIRGLVFHQGRLFIGTDKGLAVLDRAQDRFIPVAATAELNILALESMGRTGLIFYAKGKGFFKIPDSPETFKSFEFPGSPKLANVTCLKVIRGKLHIGVEGGVSEWDAGTNTVKTFAFKKPLSRRTQLMDFIEHHGSLWAGTSDDGVWIKPANSDTFSSVDAFPCKGAYVFSAEKDGFWCGTPWGLWRYYDTGKAWMQFIHPDEKKPTEFQVMALFNDGERLWYGSKELGAGYLRKDRISWLPLRAGLSRPNVAALLATDSLVVTGYGYQGGFLDVFNARTLNHETFLAPEGGPADPNLQTLTTVGNRIYYGGFESFGFYDRLTKEMRYYGRMSKLPAVDIAQIVESDSGSLLCASLFGIVKYFPGLDSFTTLTSTSQYRVTWIQPLGDSLWFGTLSQGVRVYNRKTGLEHPGLVLTEGSRIMGLSSFLRPEGGRRIFTATRNSGCFLLDPVTGSSQALSIPDTLLTSENPQDNDVTAFRAIGSEIWLGTRNNGCLIYNIDKQVWTGFGYYDGLLSDQVRSFYDDSAYIWIGCYGGFHRLDKKYYSARGNP